MVKIANFMLCFFYHSEKRTTWPYLAEDTGDTNKRKDMEVTILLKRLDNS